MRPFKFSSSSKLYVGATKEYTDGFVGCMRALVLNGVPVDLASEVDRASSGYGCEEFTFCDSV